MYIIRKANKGEGCKIFDLVRIVLNDYGLTHPLETCKDLSDLEKYYFNNNGWFAVINKDNETIGSYGIYKINNKTCELRKMYLLQDYQGQGLGKLMMENALKKAKDLGYDEIILETNSLLNKAIGLYKKFGFVEYYPNHLPDRCNLAMKLKL